MKLVFLGTGTSTGVPQLGCDCPVCRSDNPKDKRLRTSALVQTYNANILIDCGPDFREQMLRYHRDGDLDALLITHQHYDHVGGADDLRPYCVGRDPFPVYCQPDVADDLRARMPYCFADHPYPGVPSYNMHLITPLKSFTVGAFEVLPLPVKHLRLDIVGFRLGNLAYITDAKHVPEQTIEAVRGVDTLVINALRLKEHASHLSLAEALNVISQVKPRRAYLTHFSHGIGLAADLPSLLPANVHAAYDGLTVYIPD